MADISFDAAKALVRILSENDHEAYVFGEMCLLSIHNKLHKEKIPVKMITIATNLPIERLKTIFPKHVMENTYSMIIGFANNYYRIVRYHKIINYKKGIYLNIPYIEEIDKIEDFVLAQDFSIQTFYTTKDFLDNIYENNDPRIDDIRNKIIRIIGNPEEKIKENPNIIINAFYYMSKLGYQFDYQTMTAIRNHINLIKYIPLNQIGNVLYKILSEKHSYKAMLVMQELGVFNVKIDNIPLSEHLHNKDLECLKVFEDHNNLQIEIITELFDLESLKELDRLEILNDESLQEVKWLIKNKNIYSDKTDNEWRQIICDNIDDSMNIHYIKNLILKSNRRQILTHNTPSTKKQCEQFFFNLCARPYFIEQLDIDDEDILKIDKTANVNKIKKSLLEKLIFTNTYPNQEKISQMLMACIKEGLHETIKKS